MQYNFDIVGDRRGGDSLKWEKYGPEVLPLWVADMDYVPAEPILRALHRRVEHGFFGYTQPTQELRQLIQNRLLKRYQWKIESEELFFLPGIVMGLNLFLQAFTCRQDEVLVQPPVYPPIWKSPTRLGRNLVEPILVRRGDSYEIDFDAFEKVITEHTKVFILCNPHNPVARVYTRKELEQMAEVCLRHDLLICSDEIHCDLVYPGYSHIPIATLDPSVSARTITLMAATKTYNLAGLWCGFAIIQNPKLEKIWKETTAGINPGINIMGQVAASAGFKEGEEWLGQVLAYLKNNRDFLNQYLQTKIPEIHMTRMEATYLAWLDCRNSGIPKNPFDFFLKEAKVALVDGMEFGKGGEGFVRLNFACPRKTLTEALDRMAYALEKM
jgi:cysteine-S-conjugate beta-lyase